MRNLKQGFTVVELTIVVVILSLFVTIGSIGFSQVSQRAKNKVNESNAFSIALILENSYNTGYLPDNTLREKATYPSLGELEGLWPSIIKSQSSIDDDFDFIKATSKNISAPLNGSSTDPMFLKNNYEKIIYQPLNQSGELCSTGSCTAFNIFYVTRNGKQYSLTSNFIKSRYR